MKLPVPQNSLGNGGNFYSNEETLGGALDRGSSQKEQPRFGDSHPHPVLEKGEGTRGSVNQPEGWISVKAPELWN